MLNLHPTSDVDAPDEDEQEPFDEDYVWDDDAPYWDSFGNY